MAIIGPDQLPVILKVDSNPLKHHVISELGHPVVLVELMEPQFEEALRHVGDFIAQYFPLEERYAFFMTQPLQAEYPLPENAYWVRDVKWDPATTRLDDIFGAESFLFCLDESFKILDKFGSLQPLGEWRKDWRAKTPFGAKRLRIKKHDLSRPIPKTTIEYESGRIIATINHPIMANDKWRQMDELKIGDSLRGVDNTPRVQNIEVTDHEEAISVRALGAGAYWGCHSGEPVLIH